MTILKKDVWKKAEVVLIEATDDLAATVANYNESTIGGTGG